MRSRPSTNFRGVGCQGFITVQRCEVSKTLVPPCFLFEARPQTSRHGSCHRMTTRHLPPFTRRPSLDALFLAWTPSLPLSSLVPLFCFHPAEYDLAKSVVWTRCFESFFPLFSLFSRVQKWIPAKGIGKNNPENNPANALTTPQNTLKIL